MKKNCEIKGRWLMVINQHYIVKGVMRSIVDV